MEIKEISLQLRHCIEDFSELHKSFSKILSVLKRGDPGLYNGTIFMQNCTQKVTLTVADILYLLWYVFHKVLNLLQNTATSL